MTKYHKPTLEIVPHDHPFLIDYVFDPSASGRSQFQPGQIQQVIDEYLVRHIRRATTKKGYSPEVVLDLLIKEIRAGHIGKDMYGGFPSDIVEKLISGKIVTLKGGFDGMAALRLRRFGECLGIEPVDNSGSKHELGMSLLESMTQPESGGELHSFRSFIHAWFITMPRWRSHDNGCVNVEVELASAARYAPDVEWHTNAVAIAENLFNRYLKGACGVDVGAVEVGRYHGIPIRMQVLFGDERSDPVWRRGAISRDEAELLFEDQSSNSPYIRYVICTADESNRFKDVKSEIDYMKEQDCLSRLSAILLNAFSARDLAETIARNPNYVAWKMKEPQAEVATV